MPVASAEISIAVAFASVFPPKRRCPALLPRLARVLLALPVLAATWSAIAAGSPTLSAETHVIDLAGDRIAYRDIGPRTGMPLLLINRFRGTMDHWDPQLIDRIAAERRVVMFDQPGFARSTGTPPDNLQRFDATVVSLARQLDIEQFDVLGFSMGGRWRCS